MARLLQQMSDQLQLRLDASGGVLTRDEVIRSGHHDHELRRWVDAGELVLATRGAYYRPPDRDPGWACEQLLEQQAEAERRRILAVLTVIPSFCVAGGESALLLHGLPRLRRPDPAAVVQVTTLIPGRRVRRPGVRVSEPVPGLLVDASRRLLSVPDALAQVCCAHGQLAALVAADAAAHSGRLTLEELRRACARRLGCRGAGHLHGFVHQVEPLCESPGETRTLAVFRSAGIAVTPQVWISDQQGTFARVDFLIDGTRVVVEFDGAIKYTDREALRREKLREHRLHRAGYTVLRVMWADLENVPALVARIRAAIAHSSLPDRGVSAG
ncbi:DUF559 domain-containing protein [Dermacoccaceae bacterium W4C1]